MKIIITGSTGFVGSVLKERLLRDGHEIVDLAGADIRSRDIHPFFAGVDTVYHFAGRSSIKACEEDPQGTQEINVGGSANVFEAARQAGAKKVLYASTLLLKIPGAEEVNQYLKSKAQVEMLAEQYCTEHGMTILGLRYANIYSPIEFGSKKGTMIRAFIETLLRGERPILFAGDEYNARDFVCLSDVTDCNARLAGADIDAELVEIGSGTSHTAYEVFTMIQTMLGTNIRPRVEPLPSYTPRGSVCADVTVARSLGWEPKVTLEEGLRATIESVRKAKHI